MNTVSLKIPIRLLCGCVAACSIAFGHAPVAQANIFLKGMFDKVPLLEHTSQNLTRNKCKSYVRDAYDAYEKENNEKAFYLLNQYIEAQCSIERVDEVVWRRIGIMYEMGYGTIQNIEKAIQYYTKSAEVDDATAQYYLGNCFIDYKNDYKNGIQWLEKSALNGDSDAQYRLGMIYGADEWQHLNKENAFKFFKMCAQKGNIECSFELGLLYYYGEGTVEYVDKAIELIRYAAERGEGNAAYYLSGILFTDYELTEEFLGEAYLWLQVSKYFRSELNKDGELEKRLLNELSPSLKAKIDAKVPKFCSEIESRKKILNPPVE